ncbi:hypothetical protein [Corynebacterium lizhenjunii]|uniref:hypothetical protein n=1 Tax=Corynebacterium lizhenjunii TaxID=2709394 RepID=UPI0013EC6F8D|nr:hypothetical protein [Corynebacterium lizhenjunii]
MTDKHAPGDIARAWYELDKAREKGIECDMVEKLLPPRPDNLVDYNRRHGEYPGYPEVVDANGRTLIYLCEPGMVDGSGAHPGFNAYNPATGAVRMELPYCVYPTGAHYVRTEPRQPLPEPLPEPHECKPGDYYLVRIRGNERIYVGERVADDNEVQWRVAGTLRTWWEDNTITILARLTPDREVPPAQGV